MHQPDPGRPNDLDTLNARIDALTATVDALGRRMDRPRRRRWWRIALLGWTLLTTLGTGAAIDQRLPPSAPAIVVVSEHPEAPTDAPADFRERWRVFELRCEALLRDVVDGRVGIPEAVTRFRALAASLGVPLTAEQLERARQIIQAVRDTKRIVEGIDSLVQLIGSRRPAPDSAGSGGSGPA